MKTPAGFWQDSLQAMHPSLRIRYIPYFAMAASMDKSFDGMLAMWGNAHAGALDTWRSLTR